MNLSLLIHTFNQYQFLWPGSLQAWARVPRETPCYWGTDIENHSNYEFGQFKVLYSGPGTWSDRLTRLLNKIPTDYVFYCQEDHWPLRNPPDLRQMMKIVEENGLFRLQLSPVNRFYTLSGCEIPLFFDQKSKYLVNHQPSIWNKKFFLEQIHYAEDPWLNEYEGTKRLNKESGIINRIAIYPCDWFHHACIRGRMVLPTEKPEMNPG